eukprot:3678005-Pyramimonas_sp.AAC.1
MSRRPPGTAAHWALPPRTQEDLEPRLLHLRNGIVPVSDHHEGPRLHLEVVANLLKDLAVGT